MAKLKDLTPKFDIPIAERELELQMGQIPMGMNRGGLNMYSNKFKRGYGDAVFGSDENGIWLGGAEFDSAPFTVGMDGAATMKSATFKDENDTTFVDSKGVVSTANFSNQSKNGTTSTHTLPGGGSSITITGCTLTVTPSRATNYLVLFSAYAKSTGQSVTVFLEQNGSLTNRSVNMIQDGNPLNASSYHLVELAAGTYVYTLTANGDGFVYGTSCNITLINLGN